MIWETDEKYKSNINWWLKRERIDNDLRNKQKI